MNPNDTLSGSYLTGTLTLADGSTQPVLVRKIPRGDGSFGTVVIDDAQIELEKRFAHTDFSPHDHVPAGTEVLSKDPETLSSEQSTRIRLMSADLIQFVGDPDRIIAQGKLDDDRLAHLKAHPSSATMARRLCIVIGGKWAKAAQYIPHYHPDPKV